MSEKKYVPATPDSSVAKKWVNHLNAQVRKGGDIGVYSGNKNKEIIVPTSVNNDQGNLARGFFSFYIDNDNEILYVYDSLYGWQNEKGTCGYSIVGNRSIPVPEAKINLSKYNVIGSGVVIWIYVYHYIKEEGSTYPYSPTIIAAKIETDYDSQYYHKSACYFNLGRVKITKLDGVRIYTPCYDVCVNPVVLG